MLNFNLVSLHTISYTVYNCPNTEKYRVNKIHIDPGIFRIRTIVHCSEFILILHPNLISNIFHIRTMNLSWFWIHTTMYLIFQFSMDMEFVVVLSHISPPTPFFSCYDNTFILLLYPYYQIFYVLYLCSYSLFCFEISQ